MKKMVLLCALFVALGTSLAWAAYDVKALEASLSDFAQGISQSEYAAREREGSAERATLDAASENAEKAEKKLRAIVSKIEDPKELREVVNRVKAFGKKDNLHAFTAQRVQGMLKERAKFLQMDGAGDVVDITSQIDASSKNKVKHEDLLTMAQRALIMVKVPVAEAVVYVEDNKENRRVELLKALLDRHECQLTSSFVDESGDKPQTNFYISAKKFVVDALIRNYKGEEVSNNFKAVLNVSTGGFLAKKSQEFTITPARDAPEKGSFGWYRNVLEKDPFAYLSEKNFSQLSQLGKMENVAGENKLRLKNAVVEIWVFGSSATKRDAIYYNKVDFGDVYVKAR